MQMRELDKLNIKSGYGKNGSLFTGIRSWFAYRPSIIHYDWIHQYCLTHNLLSSYVKSTLFVADILIIKYLLGVKIYWTIHNLEHHDDRPRKLENWVHRFFASQCHKIRVLGEGAEADLFKCFGLEKDQFQVFPEGSYVDWYPNKSTRQSAREWLSLGDNQKVWLSFGNMRPYKGLEKLIVVFKKLTNPDLRLVIVGNPYSQKYVKQLQNIKNGDERIKILPFAVPDGEVHYYFNACDAVILPFIKVFNSGTINLAMSFRKPVVAPNIGLIPFRLSAQRELLFEKNADLEDIIVKLERMENEKLKRIGELNYENVEKFTWNNFTKFLVS